MLRFVLGMVILLALLAVTAGLWWVFPTQPRHGWHIGPYDHWPALHISPNGRTLLARQASGLTLWDIESGQELVAMPLDPAIQSISGQLLMLSPDGRKVAFHLVDHSPTGEPHPVWLLNPDSPQRQRVIRPGWPLGFTPDGGKLVVYILDRGSFLWDTVTGDQEVIDFLREDRDQGWPDLVVSSGLLFRRVRTPEGLLVIHFRTDYGRGPLRSAQFPPSERWMWSGDGKLLAAEMDNQIKLFELTTGKELATLTGPDSRFLQLPRPYYRTFFSDNSRFLVTFLEPPKPKKDEASAYVPPIPQVWDLQASPPRPVVQREQTAFHFSPNGAWVAAGPHYLRGSSQPPEHWEISDTDSFQPHLALGILEDEPVFAPDSQTVAAQLETTPSPPGWLEEWLARLGLAVSKQSKPASTSTKPVAIWDLRKGRLLEVIPDVGAFAYFPDGKALATWSEDGAIRIWDIPPRRPRWIEYGLPVVFVLLLLLGAWFVWRAIRKPMRAEVASC
jgi:WD40 repeat protein